MHARHRRKTLFPGRNVGHARMHPDAVLGTGGNQHIGHEHIIGRYVRFSSAPGGSPVAIETDLAHLNAVRARHSPAVAPLCDAYLAERHAKIVTELQRDAAQGRAGAAQDDRLPRLPDRRQHLPTAVLRWLPARQCDFHEYEGRAGLQLQRGHQQHSRADCGRNARRRRAVLSHCSERRRPQHAGARVLLRVARPKARSR